MKKSQSMFASTPPKSGPAARPSYAEQHHQQTAAMRQTVTRPNVITPGTGQQPKPGSRK